MLDQEENILEDELCVYYIGNSDDSDRFYLEMRDNSDANMTDFRYYFVLYHEQDG